MEEQNILMTTWAIGQQRMHFSDSQLHYGKQMAAGILKTPGRVCGFQCDAFHQWLNNVWLFTVTQLHTNLQQLLRSLRQLKLNTATWQQITDVKWGQELKVKAEPRGKGQNFSFETKEEARRSRLKHRPRPTLRGQGQYYKPSQGKNFWLHEALMSLQQRCYKYAFAPSFFT